MIPALSGAARAMARRRLAALVLAISALGCGRGPASDGLPRAAPGTSVLLVTLDTTRADRLGAFGHDRAGTPHLDALARSGAAFESAFTPAPTTLAAHASILTGTYPPHHGVRFNLRFRLADRPATIAEILKARGYRTIGVVAAAVLDRKFGIARGFDSFDDDLGDATRAETGIEERAADRVTDAAVRLLGEVPAGEPYFLWVHYYDPHAPYAPPPDFLAGAAGDAYQGEIAFMDSEIGRLLAAARARGAGTEPLVVALGDHGESLGEHGEDTHGLFLYDATVRIPLIVSGASVPPGTRVREIASAVDVAPTILDLLGCGTAKDMQGESLVALVHGRPREGARRGVYLETFLPRYSYGWSELFAIRTDGMKFVRAPRPELYDLSADPGETRNLLATDRARGVPLERELLRLEEGIASDEASRAATAADPETEKRLAALGYVAAPAGADGDSAGPRPDPKDMAAVHRDMERLQSLVVASRIDDALAAGEKILAADARNIHVLRTLGNALYDRGDTAAAIGFLRRAAVLDPEDFDIHQKLGNAHLQAARSATDALAVRGETERALAEFEIAAGLNPAAADAHNNVGIARLLLGERDEAEKAFRRAIELRPTLRSARYNLGRVLESSGRTLDAELEYRDVARLAPGDADAWHRVAALAAGRSAPIEALEAYRSARAADAGRFDSAVPVARILIRAGRPRDAAEILEEARAAGQGGAALFHALGLARRDLGEAGRAIEALEAAARAAPDDAAILEDLALALMNAGRFGEAAERFAKQAEVDRSSSRPAFNRGVAAERAGLDVAAKAAYEEALRRAPDDPAAANALAWLLATSRDGAVADPAKSLELARRAVGAEPRNAAYLDTLAEARRKTGDRPGAIEAIRQAIDAAPEREKAGYRKRLEEFESGGGF